MKCIAREEPVQLPEGLVPDDVDDLCSDWQEFDQRWMAAATAGCGLTLLELADEFDTYEAIDGSLHTVDFSRVDSVDELRADPAKIFEPFEDSWFEKFRDAAGGLVYINTYTAPDDCVDQARKFEAAGFRPVWLGWDRSEPPPVGLTIEENQRPIWKAIAFAKRQAAAQAAADRGQFPDDSGAAITNVDPHWTPMGDDETPPPATMNQIIDELNKRFYAWPRTVNSELFINSGHGIDFLGDHECLFGWLSRFGLVRWDKKNIGFVSQGQLFKELKRSARRYRTASYSPYEPPVEDHFCRWLPVAGDGRSLETFLDFFSPDTVLDRQLIKALLLTTVWGGPPGKRPAFVITADSGGCGAGKSTLLQKVEALHHGSMSLRADEEFHNFVKRILSPEAISNRLISLDNLKTHNLSWADLESFLTSPIISGHKMYKGEGSRRNFFTVMITLNGVDLGEDIAQRCVIIKMGAKANSQTWDTDVDKFIEASRDALLADLVSELRRKTGTHFAANSRWGAWEGGVLGLIDSPEACQQLILRRQAEANAEREGALDMEDFIAERLNGLGYDTSADRIFIPSRVAADWHEAATKKRLSTAQVTNELKLLAAKSKAGRLIYDKSRNFGARGFVWNGNKKTGEKILNDLDQKIMFQNNPAARY